MRSASREALAFRNAINVLTSLDRHELEEAEVIRPGPDGALDWAVCLQTPLTFVRRLDDDRLDRLWELMESRSAAEPEEQLGPFEYHHDEGGFVEFINEDRPYFVRYLPAPAAILVDMETRRVIGYRVYDPDARTPSPQPNLEGQNNG